MKYALFFMLFFSVSKLNAQRTTMNKSDREYLCFKINTLFANIYKGLGSAPETILAVNDPKILKDTFSMNMNLKAEPYETMIAIWDEASTTILSVLFNEVLKEFRQYKAVQLSTHSIENRQLETICLIKEGMLMYYDKKRKQWTIIK